MKPEAVLYQEAVTKANRSAFRNRPKPTTLSEALRRIEELESAVRELQMREDVAIQGSVAAHLGRSITENPYHDEQDRGFSLALVWADAYKTEREFYIAKDRLARVGDLAIAACSMKQAILANPTKQLQRVIRVFDIALARLREQTGI
jgi:hypothetical protein